MHMIPVNKVLNLWAEGMSIATISKTIKDRRGRFFSISGIGNVIIAARKAKDPRAAYHRRQSRRM